MKIYFQDTLLLFLNSFYVSYDKYETLGRMSHYKIKSQYIQKFLRRSKIRHNKAAKLN